MKTQDSFDLNNAIQQWRGNLAQSSAFRSENLHELESHLRDSIATLQTRGLAEDEAFWIASRRIGGGPQLAREFGKVNTTVVWLDRILWVLIAVQIWMAASALCAAVSFYASNAAAHLYGTRRHYSQLERTWVSAHGPGIAEITLEILVLLATPMVLVVGVIVGKILVGAKWKVRPLVESLLAKPARLAFLLFAVCFGLQCVAGTLQLSKEWHAWQIVLMQFTYQGPQYAVGSVLIAIFARKRLRASMAG